MNKNTLSDEQKIQEEEYHFPYHYIPHFDHGFFSQVKRMDWGAEYLGYMNRVIHKIHELKPNSILDVGCGDGRFIYELRQTFQNRLEGCDSSEASLRFARAFSPYINFENRNIISSRPSETFELITLIDVLEHIPLDALPQFVNGLADQLSEGGTMILTVPSDNIPLQDKHFQHFNRQSLTKVLESHFDSFEFEFINRFSKLNNFFKRLLINPYFSISHLKLQNMYFNWYKNKHMEAEESDACRIFLYCKKK